MFGKLSGKASSRMAATPTPPSRPEKRKEQSLLQAGVRLQGQLEVDGDLRVEGVVAGDLKINGTLLVGSRATIEGELSGRDVVIHGRVAGTVRAELQVRLAQGARVSGDLFCESLTIEEGVLFDGRSHMGESTKARVSAQQSPQGALPPPAASPASSDGLSGTGPGAQSKGDIARGPQSKMAYQTVNSGIDHHR